MLPFFFMGDLYIHMIIVLPLDLRMDRLILFLSYCKWCCSEHGYVGIHFCADFCGYSVKYVSLMALEFQVLHKWNEEIIK